MLARELNQALINPDKLDRFIEKMRQEGLACRLEWQALRELTPKKRQELGEISESYDAQLESVIKHADIFSHLDEIQQLNLKLRGKVTPDERRQIHAQITTRVTEYFTQLADLDKSINWLGLTTADLEGKAQQKWLKVKYVRELMEEGEFNPDHNISIADKAYLLAARFPNTIDIAELKTDLAAFEKKASLKNRKNLEKSIDKYFLVLIDQLNFNDFDAVFKFTNELAKKVSSDDRLDKIIKDFRHSAPDDKVGPPDEDDLIQLLNNILNALVVQHHSLHPSKIPEVIVRQVNSYKINQDKIAGEIDLLEEQYNQVLNLKAAIVLVDSQKNKLLEPINTQLRILEKELHDKSVALTTKIEADDELKKINKDIVEINKFYKIKEQPIIDLSDPETFKNVVPVEYKDELIEKLKEKAKIEAKFDSARTEIADLDASVIKERANNDVLIKGNKDINALDAQILDLNAKIKDALPPYKDVDEIETKLNTFKTAKLAGLLCPPLAKFIEILKKSESREKQRLVKEFVEQFKKTFLEDNNVDLLPIKDTLKEIFANYSWLPKYKDVLGVSKTGDIRQGIDVRELIEAINLNPVPPYEIMDVLSRLLFLPDTNANNLAAWLEKKNAIEIEAQAKLQAAPDQPSAKMIPKTKNKLSAHDVAKELYARAAALFTAVPMSAFQLGTKDAEMKKDLAPYTQAFDQLSRYVKDNILSGREEAERKDLIRHWLKVLNKSIKMHDYHSAFAILGALNSAEIMKLGKDNIVNAKAYRQGMKSLSSDGHYATYHHLLERNKNKLVIPYLGIAQTDITFYREGKEGFKKEKSGEVRATIEAFQERVKSAGINAPSDILHWFDTFKDNVFVDNFLAFKASVPALTREEALTKFFKDSYDKLADKWQNALNVGLKSTKDIYAARVTQYDAAITKLNDLSSDATLPVATKTRYLALIDALQQHKKDVLDNYAADLVTYEQNVKDYIQQLKDNKNDFIAGLTGLPATNAEKGFAKLKTDYLDEDPALLQMHARISKAPSAYSSDKLVAEAIKAIVAPPAPAATSAPGAVPSAKPAPIPSGPLVAPAAVVSDDKMFPGLVRIGEKVGGANLAGAGGVFEDRSDPANPVRMLIKQDTVKRRGKTKVRVAKVIGEGVASNVLAALFTGTGVEPARYANAGFYRAGDPATHAIPDETGESIYINSIFIKGYKEDFWKYAIRLEAKKDYLADFEKVKDDFKKVNDLLEEWRIKLHEYYDQKIIDAADIQDPAKKAKVLAQFRDQKTKLEKMDRDTLLEALLEMEVDRNRPTSVLPGSPIRATTNDALDTELFRKQFAQITVPRLLLADFGVHNGNFGVAKINGKYQLVCLDYGAAFNNLKAKVEPEKLVDLYKNHLLEYGEHIRLSKEMAAEFIRVGRLDASYTNNAIVRSVNELDQLYGIEPLKKFCKRLGIEENSYEALDKPGVLKVITAFMQQQIALRQVSLKQVGYMLLLEHCLRKDGSFDHRLLAAQLRAFTPAERKLITHDISLFVRSHAFKKMDLLLSGHPFTLAKTLKENIAHAVGQVYNMVISPMALRDVHFWQERSLRGFKRVTRREHFGREAVDNPVFSARLKMLLEQSRRADKSAADKSILLGKKTYLADVTKALQAYREELIRKMDSYLLSQPYYDPNQDKVEPVTKDQEVLDPIYQQRLDKVDAYLAQLKEVEENIKTLTAPLEQYRAHGAEVRWVDKDAVENEIKSMLRSNTSDKPAALTISDDPETSPLAKVVDVAVSAPDDKQVGIISNVISPRVTMHTVFDKQCNRVYVDETPSAPKESTFFKKTQSLGGLSEDNWTAAIIAVDDALNRYGNNLMIRGATDAQLKAMRFYSSFLASQGYPLILKTSPSDPNLINVKEFSKDFSRFEAMLARIKPTMTIIRQNEKEALKQAEEAKQEALVGLQIRPPKPSMPEGG